MYVHDKAILKTDVGMSICSDSSTIWDWAWNSCFGSLTCLSKFTNFCGNARNVNFCMGRTETSQHWSKLCNLQLPDKGDKQYVSASKNIEFPKTSRNNLAESTLESSSLNQIFSNHSDGIFSHFSPFSPTFPSENANFGPFVIFGDVLISRPNLMSETETGPNLSQIHNSLPFQLSSFLPLLPF